MAMTKDDYRARVPNIDERENAARLYEAMKAAEQALADADRPPELTLAINELVAERDRKRLELNDWYNAEFAKIRGPGTIGDLERADAEAARAYVDAPGDPIMENDDDESVAARCALSGAPIYETDETVEIGGKLILTCVLLTPEQIEALTSDDVAGDIEEVA